MAKWKCVHSVPRTFIPVGTVIDADEVPHSKLIVSETKRKMNGDILLEKGATIPIIGALWEWEEVE